MKERVTLTDRAEIQYIINLIETNIKQLERDLISKQKFLQKFKSE